MTSVTMMIIAETNTRIVVLVMAMWQPVIKKPETPTDTLCVLMAGHLGVVASKEMV
jgi:hypothetical protein